MTHKTLTKLVFIILLAVIGPKTTFAQKEYIYHFDTFRTVESPVFYNKIKVIDKRVEKNNIGYLRKESSLTSRKIDLKTTEGLGSSLEKYVTRFIDGEDKPNNELLLIIYDFKGEDAPIMNEFASLYIRLDAFSGANGSYKLIACIDSLYEKAAGNATRVVRPFISEKIFNIIKYLLSKDPETLQTSETFTLLEAQEKTEAFKRKSPIYTQSPRNGLFKGYEQFLNNRPEDITVIFEKIIITESLNHYNFYVVNEEGGKGLRIDAKNFFTAHYNGNWYISDGKRFQKMVLENNDFYADVKMKGPYNHTEIMAATFGLVGALISLGIDSEAWGTYKARLDLEHGKLVPVKRIR